MLAVAIAVAAFLWIRIWLRFEQTKTGAVVGWILALFLILGIPLVALVVFTGWIQTAMFGLALGVGLLVARRVHDPQTASGSVAAPTGPPDVRAQ